MARARDPLLDPRSRAWTLVAAGACLLPLLLQLGGLVAVAAGATALLVAAASWRRPLSGPVRLLLALALTGLVLAHSRFGFGRDTACGLLAAMLAIKPAETVHLRDARSLLGFALFAPFATFLLDQGPLALVLGLVGGALALAALIRLAELESGDVRHPLPAWRRFVAVWKLVAIGLPLAMAVFWLFPRLASPLWGVPDRAVARPGLSDHMTPGQWQDLLNDDTITLRARFFGATPPREQMYWRGPVLWNFDGRTWDQPGWLRGLPPASLQAGTVRWRYELEVEPTDRRQLPALDLPVSVPEGTQPGYDYALHTREPLAAVTRWQLQSAPPLAFEPELRPTLRAMALALPAGFNPRTVALARQWRAEAGTDDAAIVQRALAWIRADFAYTLATPLPGRNAVDEFLFDQRAGYCEHFSSAFAVLMRAAGIPARVVTGYAGGYHNRLGDYWIVRRSDAHAWDEVWLAGRGWVRVDPTAAVAPERIYDTLADRADAGGGFAGLRVAGARDLGDWMLHGWNDFVLGFDATRQRRLLRPLGLDGGGRLLSVFAIAAALAVLWMAWLTARAERERDPVLRAWRRLTARYARIGLARAPHEPAADWAARVAAARPAGATALQELIGRFNSWRYAGATEPRTARELVRALRRHRPAS